MGGLSVVFVVALPVLLFSGCGGVGGSHAESPKPAISDHSSSLRQPDSMFRTVAAGDTLYSIAWETGNDYRTLAEWNRIQPPYTIKLGQQIRVTPGESKNSEANGNEKSPVTQKKSPKPESGESVSNGKTVRKTPGSNGVSAPTKRIAPVDAPATTPKSAVKGKPPVVRNESSGKREISSVVWAWPAEGKVLVSGGGAANKGLDIAGNQGAIVRAAAGGRVVYQGSGLRGYGQLIIIKHNDEFLSAYAHNDKIYVKEGDVVKRGEKIAEMGSSGTDRTKLHFEIRRQGAPADPLTYLPKR